MNQRQAIILFLRDGQEEALLKPLPQGCVAGGYRQLNRRIAEWLTTTAAARTADLIVVGTERISGVATLPQRGIGFGERITNAFRDVFALGYGQAVIVGNDCPTLAPNEIADAFARLQQGAAVTAAPACDGGAYLVAVAASGFHPTNFAKLPWQTESLFAALMALPGATSVGPIRADFDTWVTSAARYALRQLMGLTSRDIFPFRIQPRSLLTHSIWRAIARPHLPAPPSI
ncbi:MAG: DUF2064 domain-containing protein [Armatimonadetes bacterium]|nr:DUF2064 domain-containing protein [Armatimonadota bacterium]